jgi:hypothetical protein
MYKYSGTSVHEFNSFLEAVRHPKRSWTETIFVPLIIYKNHKTQWNSREGTANLSKDVYWAKVTQQLTLSGRYSQLVANRCCQLACSLLETPFVTRYVFFSPKKIVRGPIFSWWEAFVNRGSTVFDISTPIPNKTYNNLFAVFCTQTRMSPHSSTHAQ